MTIRMLALLAYGTAFLLAEDIPASLQVTRTERSEFPSGGTLRMVNSTGDLTVEAWDQQGVEITTIKSLKPGYNASDREKATHELENLHLKLERRGNELVVTTEAGKYRDSSVEYLIKAPSTAKFIASHRAGEVNVDGLTGDIAVTLRRGDIFLHLPQEGQYNTSAKVDIGAVNTDYPGKVENLWWGCGHRVETGNTPASHNLNLKVGFGDIIILKRNMPKPPEPKANGL